ncbi:cytochrome P450 [Aspergillus undulatus]|uniref:cytochrome P450 n=1 Tax=Aspergillus undulatus TaxID=1810928 RepID=UPI003CCCB7F4
MKELFALFSSEGNLAIGAVVSGVVAHQAIFRHGEWHLHAAHIIFSYSALAAILLLLGQVPNSTTGSLSLAPSVILGSIVYHLAGVFLSTIIYRAVFHPLSCFPGPFAARLGGFYKIILSRNLRLFQEIRALHQQYGDIVRLGPSELSLADPAAIRKVHWPQATPRKGPQYDVQLPRVSLESTRDLGEHARLRKIWDRAFNNKALKDYSPRVQKHATRLAEVFDRNIGKAIDVAKLFNYYSFDVMGDLAFGKSFNMLVDGRDHYCLRVSHDSMIYFTLIAPLAWLFPLVIRTPLLNRPSNNFWKFVGEQVRWRMENPPDTPDVFHWILQGFRDQIHTKKGMMDLEAEAQLVIIAGSDTSASALTNAIFELVRHPKHVSKLRAEFHQLIGKDTSMSDVTPEDLAKLPHLNAVINETLRLHPPVLSGVPRRTAPQGLQIGDIYIPGDMNIQIPFHTVFRDERCFKQPDTFIPERWTDRPELTLDASVLVPFNNGTHACVGKQLALMELRWVLTMMVMQYEMEFAPGHEDQVYLDGIIDGFTMVCPPLQVRLSKKRHD